MTEEELDAHFERLRLRNERSVKITAFNCAVMLGLLIWTLAGCYPGPSVTPEPEPTADTIEQAAFDACKAHAAGLAKVASDTADKATTFKTHADAADFGAAANKAARDEAFAAFYKAVDAQLDPEHSDYDAEKTAKVFRSATKGFERAGK